MISNHNHYHQDSQEIKMLAQYKPINN